MASLSLSFRSTNLRVTRLCRRALQPRVSRCMEYYRSSTSRPYSAVAGNSNLPSNVFFNSQGQRLSSQPTRNGSSSSRESPTEVLTATIVDNYNNTENNYVAEESNHPRAALSSQAVILKQRDDDLSVDELALKTAILQHQAVVNDSPTEAETDNFHEGRMKNMITSLQSLRDALEKVEYWEDSLQVEVELESYARSALERAECIFRQGKLCVRLQKETKGLSLYQTALDIFTIEHQRSASMTGKGDTDDNTEVETDDDDVAYHADIGNVIVAMAGVHFSQDNIDECLTTLESAEDHFRRHGTRKSEHKTKRSTFSKSSSNDNAGPHIDLVKCLDNQGMMYRFKEDYYAALEKYEEALQVLGDRDITKRQALQMHIADMLKCVDDMDTAITYYEKIQKEDRERRGSDEETALDGVILQNLGTLHSQQGQLELAEDELSRALEIQQRCLGESHHEVGTTMLALGSVYGVRGNKRKALECFQQALIIERIHGKDDNDPQILHILRNIAVLHGEKVPKWGD